MNSRDFRKELEQGGCQSGCNAAKVCVCGMIEDAADEIDKLRSDKAMLIELVFDDSLSPGAKNLVAKSIRDGGLPPTQETIWWAERMAARITNHPIIRDTNAS
jgi:hypothetical protein